MEADMIAWSRRSVTRIGLVIFCALAAFASPIYAQHFYFVQMTDIHFGDDDNAARAAKVVDDINHLPMKAECVVITGDIVSENILDSKIVEMALNTMKPLKAPVHYIAGNNDILKIGDTAATRDVYVKSFGPLTLKAEYNGVIFLMLYTEPLRRPVNIPGYDPLKWLAQALKDAGKKPVIIFTHSPVDDDFWGNEIRSLGWPKETRNKWEALIKSHNVKAVVTGHFHRDELHWISNTPEFVSAPIASSFGRQITYRLYEYTDGKIDYRTIYLN